MKLYLVRHGSTVGNERQILQGKKDFPLSSLGEKQCELLALRLKNEKGNFQALFSSSQGRAVATAEILAAYLGLEVKSTPLLGECCFGEIEGLEINEIRQRYPQVWQRARETSWGEAAAGGESRRELMDRVTTAFELVKSVVVPGEEVKVIIVSHASPLKALVSYFVGLGPEDQWPFVFDNASLTILDTSGGDGRKRVRLLNDCCHLRSER